MDNTITKSQAFDLWKRMCLSYKTKVSYDYGACTYDCYFKNQPVSCYLSLGYSELYTPYGDFKLSTEEYETLKSYTKRPFEKNYPYLDVLKFIA